ncbi:DUF4123 domain-containing protein [Agrobacterium sp. fls2-241-TYG-188a]|uniref:DUF4123 domain-containing protein n=1 Tax=Agrobacterium sp. fls2-241-TYG-188a TaxID=3040275 RepID=UPI0025512DDB|nr:DUF4123 domain-containing protein [Agrobacterium sp. fls2-241-TYG-188a]
MTDTPTIDLPNPNETAELTRQATDAMTGVVSAVLDGGAFDNLPRMLQEEGIGARSLFLEGASADFRLAGPWLVNLEALPVRSYIGWLDSKNACAVYWSCPGGDDTLYRHLRTLNEVMIPLEQTGAYPQSTSSQQYERVLFRHWDPNVLGALLPILTRPQLARFLGPADCVVLNAPDYGGVKRVKAPPDLPAPPPGPLRIEQEQIEKLKTAMLHSSRLRIARFLKSNPPPHFTGLNDDFFWGATLASEASADDLGIKTERGRARWASVMVLSDGKAAELPEVRSFLQEKGATPDNQVKALIGYTADALRSGTVTGVAL